MNINVLTVIFKKTYEVERNWCCFLKKETEIEDKAPTETLHTGPEY